jgi:hypothetical protein
MKPRDGVLAAATWLLRAVMVVNGLSAVGFPLFVLFTFVFPGVIEARLAHKYGAAFDIAQALWALRAICLLGLIAVAISWVIASRLMAMIATVAQGDPFTAANARRLTTLGWAMLAWQVHDLAVGAMVGWFAHLGVDHFNWTPSFAGWIVVVMMFVLARVFAHGAAMREELEATI